MAKETVLVVCPGRGTYGAAELGSLARYAGHSDLARFDAMRAEAGAPTLSELDGAVSFSTAMHASGPNAAPLIYAAGWLDFRSLDFDRFDIVAVTGNSMGWYTALACARAVSADHGFAIADAMGTHSGRHGDGGQLLVSLAGDDWRVDPALRAEVLDRAARHGALPSIDLGGMLVLAGETAALSALSRDLPALPGRAPMKLAGHGPFHTPLMQGSSRAALETLPVEWFGQPQVPLIDGTGRIWHRRETDPAALHAYTFANQILRPYDFAAAITVGLKEFAPDRVVLVGPGDTLGGAIGQIIVRESWLGMHDKALFTQRQASDPFLIAMGRDDQRALMQADR